MPLSPTPRTTLHRLRERARTERGDLYAVLDAGLICHLGVVVDGAPVVLPTGYGRIGDTLYLHGSSANRSLLAAAGQEVCATITLLDGLVCARSIFNHSMNYRSAVVIGPAGRSPTRLSASTRCGRSPSSSPPASGTTPGSRPARSWPPPRCWPCRWPRPRSRCAPARPMTSPRTATPAPGRRHSGRPDLRPARARPGAQPGRPGTRARHRHGQPSALTGRP